MGTAICAVPEVTDYQAYAGTAAPINFNGLVRQYYLRTGPEVGDLQVNLVDKHRPRPQEPRDRAGDPSCSRGDRQKTRRRRQGGRSAARPAGDVADRRRNLRSRLRRADPGRQAGARRLRKIRRHRRHRRHGGGRRPALRAARAAEQGGAVGRGAEGHRRGDEDGPVGRKRHPHPRQRRQVRNPGAHHAAAGAPDARSTNC